MIQYTAIYLLFLPESANATEVTNMTDTRNTVTVKGKRDLFCEEYKVELCSTLYYIFLTKIYCDMPSLIFFYYGIGEPYWIFLPVFLTVILIWAAWVAIERRNTTKRQQKQRRYPKRVSGKGLFRDINKGQELKKRHIV